MAYSTYSPRPLFDTLEHLQALYKQCQINEPCLIIRSWLKHCLVETDMQLPSFCDKDYQPVLYFLYSYRGSTDTFNAYRRELERLLQWAWFVQHKSILQLKRLDIEAFLEFCQKPYKRWIGVKTVARFLDKEGLRQPNSEWRPFIVKVSKKAFQDGEKPDKINFELSQQGIKQLFAILSSFYNYLIQEEFAEINPVVQIRQKSKFIQKTPSSNTIRRLSELQWKTVINSALKLAEEQPDVHERTLFIMQLLYGLYLRISELAASKRWTPKMGHFFRDANGDWWFKTVGKGNKMRQIAVSSAILTALKHYRQHLNLSPMPSPDDSTPLIEKARGKGPIESTRAIRQIVQFCFDKAIEQLRDLKQVEEAEMLRSATVHWLRHTGISDDVKHRPREHVRDDAGHSSSAITDKYIDVELQARAKSAKKKTLGLDKVA